MHNTHAVRFPATSSHMRSVELVLKGMLCTRFGSKGQTTQGPIAARRLCHATRPNKAKIAVHGRHCLCDMATTDDT